MVWLIATIIKVTNQWLTPSIVSRSPVDSTRLEVRAAAAMVCEVPGSLIEQIIQIKQQLALVWALSGPHTRHLMDLGSVAGAGRGGGGTVSRITATCYPLPRGCCPPIPPHPHICCVALLRLHYVPVSCCFSTSTTCWCCLRLACVIGSGSNKNYKEFWRNN